MGEEWSGRAGNGGGDGIHVTQAKVVAVRVSPSSSLAVERDGPHSLSLSPPSPGRPSRLCRATATPRDIDVEREREWRGWPVEEIDSLFAGITLTRSAGPPDDCKLAQRFFHPRNVSEGNL